MKVLLLVRYALPLLSLSIALLKGVSALFAALTFWAFYGSIREYDNSDWISFIEENGFILSEGEYKWKFVILPHLIYMSISFVE